MTGTAKARMTEAELAALADALAGAPGADPGRAEAAAAALDAALTELAAAPVSLPDGLRARMEADAARTLARTESASPAATRGAQARGRPADPRRAGALAAARRSRPGLLTRIGAPAAFAASAAMGVALGYSGNVPLADSVALLAGDYNYESAFLQSELLPEPDLPALEESR